MKIYAYTRIEPNEDAATVKREMSAAVKQAYPNEDGISLFRNDGQGGKLGLTHTLRRIEDGDILAVRHLSDVARDLQSCVKALLELAQRQIAVYATASGLFLAANPEEPDTRTVFALANAHQRYVSENRKLGVAAARQAGATMGRPTIYTLDDVRETIRSLTNANEGALPTVRELAKKLKCGNTKAMELLHEYKAEQEGTK